MQDINQNESCPMETTVHCEASNHPVEISGVTLSVKPRFKRRTGGPGGLGIVPTGEGAEVHESPVVLNAVLLKSYFNMPLHSAAKALGVCATAIKKVCRKIGIKHWPHRKIKAVEKKLAMLTSEETLRKRAAGAGAVALAGAGGVVGKDPSDPAATVTTTTSLDSMDIQAEIDRLQRSRELLLQGVDCDVGGAGGAHDDDDAGGGNHSDDDTDGTGTSHASRPGGDTQQRAAAQPDSVGRKDKRSLVFGVGGRKASVEGGAGGPGKVMAVAAAGGGNGPSQARFYCSQHKHMGYVAGGVSSAAAQATAGGGAAAASLTRPAHPGCLDSDPTAPHGSGPGPPAAAGGSGGARAQALESAGDREERLSWQLLRRPTQEGQAPLYTISTKRDGGHQAHGEASPAAATSDRFLPLTFRGSSARAASGVDHASPSGGMVPTSAGGNGGGGRNLGIAHSAGSALPVLAGTLSPGPFPGVASADPSPLALDMSTGSGSGADACQWDCREGIADMLVASSPLLSYQGQSRAELLLGTGAGQAALPRFPRAENDTAVGRPLALGGGSGSGDHLAGLDAGLPLRLSTALSCVDMDGPLGGLGDRLPLPRSLLPVSVAANGAMRTAPAMPRDDVGGLRSRAAADDPAAADHLGHRWRRLAGMSELGNHSLAGCGGGGDGGRSNEGDSGLGGGLHAHTYLGGASSGGLGGGALDEGLGLLGDIGSGRRFTVGSSAMYMELQRLQALSTNLITERSQIIDTLRRNDQLLAGTRRRRSELQMQVMELRTLLQQLRQRSQALSALNLANWEDSLPAARQVVIGASSSHEAMLTQAGAAARTVTVLDRLSGQGRATADAIAQDHLSALRIVGSKDGGCAASNHSYEQSSRHRVGTLFGSAGVVLMADAHRIGPTDERGGEQNCNERLPTECLAQEPAADPEDDWTSGSAPQADDAEADRRNGDSGGLDYGSSAEVTDSGGLDLLQQQQQAWIASLHENGNAL